MSVNVWNDKLRHACEEQSADVKREDGKTSVAPICTLYMLHSLRTDHHLGQAAATVLRLFQQLADWLYLLR